MKELYVDLIGLQPGLLLHRFSESEAQAATNGIRGNQSRELTPREIAELYLYKDNNGNPGIPGMSIYRALIDAGTFIKDGKSKLSTQRGSKIPSMLWVNDEFCRFDNGEWEVDSRPVVIPATNGRIIRHRPRFDNWRTRVKVSYDPHFISMTTVIDLFNKAGSCIGLGDFRPARRGPFGRFCHSLKE